MLATTPEYFCISYPKRITAALELRRVRRESTSDTVQAAPEKDESQESDSLQPLSKTFGRPEYRTFFFVDDAHLVHRLAPHLWLTNNTSGMYTYGHEGGHWTNNSMHHNHQYG